MITLLIALFLAGGTFSAAFFAGDFGLGWSITLGVLGFLAFQAVAGVMMQKRVKREMDAVQKVLLEGQKQLQAKAQRWQLRPPGSIEAMQREVFADTCVFVKRALGETERLEKYRLWVPMMGRQIATARLQLNWMIKNFKEVDRLMPQALFIDPTMTAIRMARLYMTDGAMADIEKAYRKGVRRTRYNGNVLLAATMSWIQVEKGDVDGAFRTLTEALKKSDDATLKRNHQELMNNRPAHFSNSGLGDAWYALLLEEPRVRTQRQHPVWR